MTPQEQLRHLLKKAKSKIDAQRIAREFLTLQKAKEMQKKKEVDPSEQAEQMMKRLRQAHQQVRLLHLHFLQYCLLQTSAVILHNIVSHLNDEVFGPIRRKSKDSWYVCVSICQIFTPRY